MVPGLRRLLQLCWLAITILLVILQIESGKTLEDAKGVAVLLGLLALFIKALLSVWQWADLAWRKVWLWSLNSSVNWTLEVRVEVPECIEEVDITMLLNALQTARQRDRISRASGSDTISLESDGGYSMTIRPLQSGDQASWILRFGSVHIGYRDATRVLQRVFVPLVDMVVDQISNAGHQRYAIEARFATINPYAAVLLNDLRVQSADRVLLTFKHDGSTVQLTKDSIVSSSESQADAVHAMSTVFGISLRGALSASHL